MGATGNKYYYYYYCAGHLLTKLGQLSAGSAPITVRLYSAMTCDLYHHGHASVLQRGAFGMPPPHTHTPPPLGKLHHVPHTSHASHASHTSPFRRVVNPVNALLTRWCDLTLRSPTRPPSRRRRPRAPALAGAAWGRHQDRGGYSQL